MPGPSLASDYFDGQRPTSQPVGLHIDGQTLVIHGDGVARRVPLQQIRWPRPRQPGPRLTYLPGQGLISHADGEAWDQWARSQNLRDPGWVRWTRGGRGWLGAVLVVAMVGALTVAALWHWVVPGVSRVVVAMIPAAVDQTLGAQGLASFDNEGLAPSRLPAERQATIRAALAQAVERAYAVGERPIYTLHFRGAGQKSIGPNAFALPGGHMVLTDELADLLADSPDVLTGVLAHELGHVRHRHGVHTVVQSSLLMVVAGVIVGDFTSVVAAVPVVLGQQAYARDFERQADQEAINVLRANGVAPSRMLVLFDRLAAWREKQGGGSVQELPIAVADHPADAERKAAFRAADGAR